MKRREIGTLIFKYFGAVGAVFLAWLVRWSLEPALQGTAPYVTFVGAVLLTTWLSGLGPGLAALVLSVVVIWNAFLAPQASGTIHPAEAVGLALYVIVLSICIGVTETLRAIHEERTAALRLSDERFRLMTEAIPSMVWTAAPDGKITYVNKKWTEYGGPGTEHTTACPGPGLHPSDHERCAEAWTRSVREGREYEIEVRHRRYDGAYRWFVTRAVPWKDEQGRVISWFGITTDIHEQKELQEGLREADRRKDEFLATLAHELRNPLAPMRNSLEVMRRAGERREDVDVARAIMERQLIHMVRLVDDLLDLSRITRGRIELRMERLDLAAAMEDALETCRPQFAERHQHVTLDPPDLPVFVNADRTRLAQVFTNLLSNASKYSPNGSPISLSGESVGDWVTVKVRDQGIGVAPEALPRIFEIFSQAIRSNELTDGGLGIGLSLVRGLVEQHGGEVEARSEGLGRGSEFIVRLPVAREAPPIRTRERDSGDGHAAPRRRVLIADDNRDSADSLAIMLSLMGHETQATYDGATVIEKAEAYNPDVILLDLGMPVIDGYEAARRIREQGWSNGVVLVALTGWGQEEDRVRAREAGFNFHLTKPANPHALGELLGATAPRPNS